LNLRRLRGRRDPEGLAVGADVHVLGWPIGRETNPEHVTGMPHTRELEGGLQCMPLHRGLGRRTVDPYEGDPALFPSHDVPLRVAGVPKHQPRKPFAYIVWSAPCIDNTETEIRRNVVVLYDQIEGRQTAPQTEIHLRRVIRCPSVPFEISSIKNAPRDADQADPEGPRRGAVC